MKKPSFIVLKFLRFCFQSYKPYFLAILFKCIVTAGLTVFNAYSLSLLIRYLETEAYREALFAGAAIVGINFAFYFLNKLVIRINAVSQTAMQEAINQNISSRLTRIPYQYLEDPDYLDLKDRAKFAIENQDSIYSFLNSFANLIQYGITIAALATILVLFDIWLIVTLISALVLNVIILLVSLKTQINFNTNLIPINRKYGYYLQTLLDERKAKDYRMYSVGGFLERKFEKFGKTTFDYFFVLMKKFTILGISMDIVKYAEMAMVYGLVAVKTIVNHLPVSTFSLYISTALSFSTVVSSLTDTVLGYIRSVQYITPFVQLTEIPLETEGKKIPFTGTIDSIEFSHVTFSYPKSKAVILDDISFSISAGEKISIVGLNGAGKTTLIKLLCRLYKPQSGDILINGISIYDYDASSYHKQVSAVFQDYKLFAYSLKENILNHEGSDDVAYEIACKVGLKEKIDSLSNGINSLYTKSYEENGIELSGGEAQKVAIARALYTDASIVILDEPTSALDPLAEADIYKNFNDLVEDKTAIYISHRMSSSVFCDRILILEEGKITDFDTHVNLMKKTESLYYRLFMAQAKNYAK